MSRSSNIYAPEGTCPYCGFRGKDWGFKYHRSCTKCYNKYRKEKAAEWRRDHPNVNVELEQDLIVTTNVHRRLSSQSNKEVPLTDTHKSANNSFYFGLAFMALPLLLYLLGFEVTITTWLVCSIIAVIVFNISDKIIEKEYQIRRPIVEAHTKELARERKRLIEETKQFYGSPEWRLLRKEIIKSQKNICKSCGKVITDKFDITVDHIMPRSKFPEKALDIKNMQILCRACNSSKGNKVIDYIDLEELEG